jgi:hypothetical protein
MWCWSGVLMSALPVADMVHCTQWPAMGHNQPHAVQQTQKVTRSPASAFAVGFAPTREVTLSEAHMRMILENGLVIDQEATKVTVRSMSHGPSWILFVSFAFPVVVVVITATQTGQLYWFGLVLGLGALGLGAFLSSPRSVTTTFDLGTRQVVYEHSSGERHVYSMAEISGVGLKKYGGFYSFFENTPPHVPVMALRDGKTLWLAVYNGGDPMMSRSVKGICSATGLKELHLL